ncbi:phosphate signaling complex protein PhoU [Oceanirhabdus seepicola]|uniref:Phosphate-specific transport system accessory protein PhoU n=1 Tax=Oceanirhabdus seepicola TaxID=2828781 RepID=A0A9J6P5Z3_9CLOT|nr:phosphate signaling complex protein PhoU [Oceanirhabdus seepicola]MCM1990896.1 phosphate signaling complex protein PhoU [Oceanirhabdus seepicola]
MVRNLFQNSIKELHKDIDEMGSFVATMVKQSIEALKNKDIELAEKLIQDDDIADNFEKSIEEKAIILVARQQPMASDLRDIFTITKVVTDLERIADLSVDIAKITIRLKDQEYIKKLIDIPRMANIIDGMLHDALEAYLKKDVHMAQKTCKVDDEIDSLNDQIFSELLVKMMEKPSMISQSSQFLFVCRHLERIADHITNICEWTLYSVTGEHVDLNQ